MKKTGDKKLKANEYGLLNNATKQGQNCMWK